MYGRYQIPVTKWLVTKFLLSGWAGYVFGRGSGAGLVGQTPLPRPNTQRAQGGPFGNRNLVTAGLAIKFRVYIDMVRLRGASNYLLLAAGRPRPQAVTKFLLPNGLLPNSCYQAGLAMCLAVGAVLAL